MYKVVFEITIPETDANMNSGMSQVHVKLKDLDDKLLRFSSKTSLKDNYTNSIEVSLRTRTLTWYTASISIFAQFNWLQSMIFYHSWTAGLIGLWFMFISTHFCLAFSIAIAWTAHTCLSTKSLDVPNQKSSTVKDMRIDSLQASAEDQTIRNRKQSMNISLKRIE
ncbi:hypothetical protein Ciccas_000544 [Cichlidogyrus casuarinus]|uniref:Seipin n=1 Tax=Cichlidogyrus casuarinus TaxID=1844966 RepID=A0ABD2QMW6_9PLAT